MKKTKKRSVTLIEIMIVILLIGLIGGALAYNMRGSMDQGKIFKTKQNIERVHDILMMESVSKDLSLAEVVKKKEDIMEKSGLVKNGKELLKDGWGNKLKVRLNDEGDDILVNSEKLDNYENGEKT